MPAISTWRPRFGSTAHQLRLCSGRLFTLRNEGQAGTVALEVNYWCGPGTNAGGVAELSPARKGWEKLSKRTQRRRCGTRRITNRDRGPESDPSEVLMLRQPARRGVSSARLAGLYVPKSITPALGAAVMSSVKFPTTLPCGK